MQASRKVGQFVSEQSFQEKLALLLRHNSSENYWLSSRNGDSFLALIDVLKDKQYLSATPFSRKSYPEIYGQVNWDHNPMFFNVRDGKTIAVRYQNFIPSDNLPSKYLPESSGEEYCVLELDGSKFERIASGTVNHHVVMLLDELFYGEQQRIIDERIINIYKEQQAFLRV